MHYARLTAVEERAGPKGTYLAYTCTVEEDSEDRGKDLPYRVSLSSAARWKMNEFLDSVGAPTSGSSKGSDHLGKLIKIHVVEGTYDDKPRSEIDGVFPLGVEDPNPAAGETIRAQAANILSDSPAPTLVPNTDDEIPF
jgi:hypothetical protein